MILFYLDVSGTGLGDSRSHYFVLSAVGIPADRWKLVDSQFSAPKRRLIPWAKPEDFEIKGRDMRRGDKLFKGLDWAARVAAIDQTAQLLSELPCRVFSVQVDKRDLPEYISSDDMMYRLSLSRLLDRMEAELSRIEQPGMLMFDMRSDLHSSVQDRRLIDAYRNWVGDREGQTRFIEMPWFGFSAFYAGLQLADFSAYLIDFVSNEAGSSRGRSQLTEAYAKFEDKVVLVRIP